MGRVGGVLGGRLGLAVGSEACSAAGSEGGPADSREASDGRHARTGTGRPGRACGSVVRACTSGRAVACRILAGKAHGGPRGRLACP